MDGGKTPELMGYANRLDKACMRNHLDEMVRWTIEGNLNAVPSA